MDNFEVIRNAGFTEMLGLLPSSWWVNREYRVAFNFEAVEDADTPWLENEIRWTVKPGYFSFYFAPGTTMDGRVCGVILDRLSLPDLAVEMLPIKTPLGTVHVFS